VGESAGAICPLAAAYDDHSDRTTAADRAIDLVILASAAIDYSAPLNAHGITISRIAVAKRVMINTLHSPS
jgi:hypothetical protein